MSHVRAALVAIGVQFNCSKAFIVNSLFWSIDEHLKLKFKPVHLISFHFTVTHHDNKFVLA